MIIMQVGDMRGLTISMKIRKIANAWKIDII